MCSIVAIKVGQNWTRCDCLVMPQEATSWRRSQALRLYQPFPIALRAISLLSLLLSWHHITSGNTVGVEAPAGQQDVWDALSCGILRNTAGVMAFTVKSHAIFVVFVISGFFPTNNMKFLFEPLKVLQSSGWIKHILSYFVFISNLFFVISFFKTILVFSSWSCEAI